MAGIFSFSFFCFVIDHLCQKQRQSGNNAQGGRNQGDVDWEVGGRRGRIRRADGDVFLPVGVVGATGDVRLGVRGAVALHGLGTPQARVAERLEIRQTGVAVGLFQTALIVEAKTVDVGPGLGAVQDAEAETAQVGTPRTITGSVGRGTTLSVGTPATLVVTDAAVAFRTFRSSAVVLT